MATDKPLTETELVAVVVMIPVPGVNPAGPYSTVKVPPATGFNHPNTADVVVTLLTFNEVGEGHEVGAKWNTCPATGIVVEET